MFVFGSRNNSSPRRRQFWFDSDSSRRRLQPSFVGRDARCAGLANSPRIKILTAHRSAVACSQNQPAGKTRRLLSNGRNCAGRDVVGHDVRSASLETKQNDSSPRRLPTNKIMKTIQRVLTSSPTILALALTLLAAATAGAATLTVTAGLRAVKT